MVHINCSSEEAHEWGEVASLSCKEDVATVLFIYEKALSSIKPENIVNVVEKDGFYACMVNSEGGAFDFFQWLNSKKPKELAGVEINCANAKLLFPLSLSRGEYTVSQSVGGTGDMSSDNSDEVPTGFLDEDDIEETRYLLHKATGSRIPIDSEEGVIIGRSSSRSEYAVDNIMLSRVHARVYLTDGRYMVEDLHSQNGTFIGKLKVLPGKDREIRTGDLLRLADENFQLV